MRKGDWEAKRAGGRGSVLLPEAITIQVHYIGEREVSMSPPKRQLQSVNKPPLLNHITGIYT